MGAGAGLYYEDLAPGTAYVSRVRVLTRADVREFADLSGDRNPIHLDDDAARAAGFEAAVAHGVLGLAVASGLASELEITRGTLIALTGISWRFRAPVHADDRVVLHLSVASRRATTRPDRGLVTLAAELRNQDGVVVQEGEFVELVRRRPPAG